MKVAATLYNVELNSKEINTIVNAIQAAYLETKEEYEALPNRAEVYDDVRKLNDRLSELKELRNSFAQLVNRQFMGKDA